MKYSIALLAAAAAVQASPVPVPQAVTAAISPTGAPPPGCTMMYSGSFGIAVMNITSGGSGSVNTISDGQPQASSGSAVKTISDGQPQATTGTASAVKTISDGQPQAATATATVAPVTQISDGQIQASTGMKTMTAINQISDGQIQNMYVTAVKTISDGQPQAPTATATAVKTISDGQPQAATGTAVSTLSDGQPQAPTGTAVSTISDGQPQAPTGTAVSTISDGQPQAPTATGTAVNTISDGQPQASGTSSSSGSPTGVQMVACKASDSLTITLNNGVLTDNQGRTGYIAANYQFQFDGPPQAGAIYTAGWSACSNGSLALGGSNIFYQCLSGNFYNLYDRSWAPQCVPITINAIQLVNC